MSSIGSDQTAEPQVNLDFDICIITVKILIIARAFIRIITFHKEEGGCLLDATVFDNSWKNFKIFFLQ